MRDSTYVDPARPDEGEARDVVFVHVAAYFSWRDRLRILFGRTAHVRVLQPVRCRDGVISADQASSSVWVDTLRPRKPSGGYCEAAPVLPEQGRRPIDRIHRWEAAP